MKRTLWWVLAAAVLAALVLEWVPRPREASRLDALPLQGFGLTGRDLPLTETEAAFFRHARFVKRLYQAGDTSFILLAVDGAENRHVIHDPLYCFRGAGWTLTRSTPMPLPSGQGRVLRLSRGHQTVETLYWFSNGRDRYVSALRLWWESVQRRVHWNGAGGEPVLVILQPAVGTTLDWNWLATRCPQLFLF